MVFKGQDAWRKHPLLSGNYKNPLPGLGLAIGIFSVYLAIDWVASKDHGVSIPSTPRYKIVAAGVEQDTMPEVIDKKASH